MRIEDQCAAADCEHSSGSRRCGNNPPQPILALLLASTADSGRITYNRRLANGGRLEQSLYAAEAFDTG